MSSSTQPQDDGSSSEEDQFEDAEEVDEAMDDELALIETKKAIGLLLGNDIAHARDLLEKKAETSMYHSLGYSTILFMEAVMTWELENVEVANAALKHSCTLSKNRQKKINSFTSLLGGPQFSAMTNAEMHAEVCHAESLLLRAMATFVEDESFIAFVKGGLKVKECHGVYKGCYQFLEKSARSSQSSDKPEKADGSKMGKLSAKMSSKLKISKDGKDKSNLKKKPSQTDMAEAVLEDLHEEFVSGVRMGYGLFNLMISMLPPRILKLLEFIGFKGNRELGLKLLYQSGETGSLRANMSNLAILCYHYVIVYYLNLVKEDTEAVDRVLDNSLQQYPNGAFFLFYKGRRHLAHREPDQAIVALNASVEAQSDWTQMHHICYWELMFANACAGKWDKAGEYSTLLFKESKWSKCNFKYMEASFKYMELTEGGREITEKEKADLLKQYNEVAEFKQRIAGKSIPSEKFVIRKARKFSLQNGYLMLPGLEIMIHWNILQYMDNYYLQSTLNLVLKSIATMQKLYEQTAAQKKKKRDSKSGKSEGNGSDKVAANDTYVVDDLCLCYFLRGSIESALLEYDDAEGSLLEVLKYENGIELDHWIAPYATAELGFLYFQTKRFKESETMIKRAMDAYKGYSMESRLHFRAHSILKQVRVLLVEGKNQL